MFTLNDKLDEAVLKPAAVVYRSTLPTFAQVGIGNVCGNLDDPWTGINNLLQGKAGDGLTDFMRFAVNSTIGLGGLLDIGSEAGMSKHKVDFGKTLGHWGVKAGPYVVLPLFGPTTLRDSLALPLDLKGDPLSYLYPISARHVGVVVREVDMRASMLDASKLIEDAALDRYEFVRDAYLQRRESRVNGGD